jgi:hypothetical protein
LPDQPSPSAKSARFVVAMRIAAEQPQAALVFLVCVKRAVAELEQRRERREELLRQLLEAGRRLQLGLDRSLVRLDPALRLHLACAVLQHLDRAREVPDLVG